MILAPMKFKDYVWPHNPKVYEIRFKKDIVSHRVPFGLYVLQNTGRSHRVLRGEGEFCGEGAYTQFQKLASVFYNNQPGTLVHPLWMTTRAYFASLELVQEPREDYVKYSFEFWECYDGYDTAFKRISVNNDDIDNDNVSDNEGSKQENKPTVAEPKYYTVKNGDTMSGIALAHSMTLEKLIELNPQVSNINLIHTGQQLRVG